MIYIRHATGSSIIYPLAKCCVSVFFVISGFVLTLSYRERPIEASGKDAIRFSAAKIKPLFPLHGIMLLFGLLREILTSHNPWYKYVVELLIVQAVSAADY